MRSIFYFLSDRQNRLKVWVTEYHEDLIYEDQSRFLIFETVFLNFNPISLNLCKWVVNFFLRYEIEFILVEHG